MRKLFIHIKPTKKCNLKCRYCFEMENNNSPYWLDLDKIKYIMDQIGGFCREIKIEELGMHYSGGEVFTLGLNYWRKALEMQKSILKKRSMDISTHFQTNLTLLNEDYLHLIKRNKINVGTSLDPFSSTRIFRSNGKTITNTVIDNMISLAQNKIRSGVIVMITKENYKKAGEIFDLFNEARISFHVLKMMGNADHSAKDLMISGEEYGEALILMLERYLAVPANRRIPQPSLDSYIQNIKCGAIYNPASMCSFEKYCLNNRVFIENDGRVYPCDQLQTDGFCLGNIFKTPLISIVYNLYNKPIFKKLRKRNMSSQKGCRDCTFVNLCNGGCINDCYWEGNLMGKSDFYCKTNKKVYSYLLGKKKIIANK